jgi:intein/homing endonuclease
MGLLRVLAVGAYDLLWMMNDISVIAPMMVHVDKLRVKKEKEGRTPFKVLFYTPIDSYPLPSHFPTLKNIEQIVTYTKYGKKAMDECFEKMDVKPVSKIDVIPHGMDTKVFKPLDNKMELREKYKLPTDAILFGNINKNQPRKDIGTTLIAFAQVKKQNPKEKYALYLHCYHSDHAGINLYRACERLNLKVGKDVFFPTDARYLNAEYTPSEINEIYNCLDVFVNTTMSEGWGLCLHPKSLIETNDGIKELCNVNIGDKVLTHTGDFKIVLDTTKRIVHEYFEITTEYSNIPTYVTKEHPFLVLKNGDMNKLGWVNVQDIRKGDYLAIRKPIIQTTNTEFIDILEYLDKDKFLYDDTHVWHKMGFSPFQKDWSLTTICTKYNVKKHIAERAISSLMGSKKSTSEVVLELSEQLKKDGFKKNTPLRINRHIKLTKELFEIFGWYLAEGSNGGKARIEFDLNGGLIDSVAPFIQKVCEEAFDVPMIIDKNGENKCRVRGSSVVFANFMGNLLGVHAKNKTIPELLYNHKHINNLIKGLFKGDGYIKASANTISLSSISNNLIFQTKSILAGLDIMTSVSKYTLRTAYNLIITRDSLSKFNEQIMNNEFDLERNSISNAKPKRKHIPNYKSNDEYFFVKLKSKTPVEKTQEMYDLCIDGSHSFVANGIVCHNTTTEAMCVGLPIVCPLHTSLSEITDNGRLTYSKITLYEHFQMGDAEYVRFKSDPKDVMQMMLVASWNIKNNKEDLFKKYQRKFVEYNWDNIAKQFEQHIKNLL